MPTLVNISIVVFLSLIVIQDFKQRQISWVLIPLTFIAFIVKALITSQSVMQHIMLNIAFVIIQYTLLTLYMSVKNKKLVNILNDYIGLGDVLFFIVLCAAFSPLNFIAFYLFSTFTTLIGFVIYRLLSTKTINEIPLAGAMSGVLIALIFISKLVPQLNFYDDANLLNIIKL